MQTEDENTMAGIDKDKELDRRRVTAAKRFLEAVDRYNGEGRCDGLYIVKTYLAKFDDSDSDRAKLAIEIAEQTSRNIDSFGTELLELSSKVSLSLMSSEGQVLSATVDAMGAILKSFNSYLDDVNDRISNPRRSDPQIRTNEQLDTELKNITENAREKMELTIAVAELASEIIEGRCDTLRDFRENNLEVSRKLFIERLRKLIAKAPKEASFATFRKLGEKAIDEVIEVAPVVRWIFWLKKKTDKIVRPVGTKAGDTDVMLKLLPALKSTSKLADELRLAYARSLKN